MKSQLERHLILHNQNAQSHFIAAAKEASTNQNTEAIKNHLLEVYSECCAFGGIWKVYSEFIQVTTNNPIEKNMLEMHSWCSKFMKDYYEREMP